MQFYVADIDIDPLAPEDWTENDIQRHYAQCPGIVALSPMNDMVAKVNVHWFEVVPDGFKADFIAHAELKVTGKRIGIMGWPWEEVEVRDVTPGEYKLIFSGHDIDLVEDDGDYYNLWIIRVGI